MAESSKGQGSQGGSRGSNNGGKSQKGLASSNERTKKEVSKKGGEASRGGGRSGGSGRSGGRGE